MVGVAIKWKGMSENKLNGVYWVFRLILSHFLTSELRKSPKREVRLRKFVT